MGKILALRPSHGRQGHHSFSRRHMARRPHGARREAAGSNLRPRMVDFRILLEKLKYFKSDNHVPILPDMEKLDERIPDKEGQKFFLSLAGRSTTIVCVADIPFKPEENEDILLVSAYKDFFKYGLKRFPKAKIIKIYAEFFFKYNFYHWNQ